MTEQPPYQPPPEGQPPVPPPYQPPPPPSVPPPGGYQAPPAPPPPPAGYQPSPPPPAPPGAYPQPAGYVQAAAPNNQKALISLILSIVSLFFCGLIGIAGIILGSSAKKEIRQTGEQGESLATAGQIIGAISLVLWVALPLLFFFGIMAAIVGSNPH